MDVVAGRFRLLAAIGKGNMGEVYRAEDLASAGEDPVAVKLILRDRSGTLLDSGRDDKAVLRFEREVRIMRKLDHPNIPRLVDGGVEQLPYLAMEFLDGRTLRDLVSEYPQLPIPWVAALGAQIADGLAAAHAQNIVHRDLKPANVMLVHGGVVKVLDFGMGRIIDDVEGEKVTTSGVTVGTARYMAPEQFEASAVTQAADLYALGCMLFEMLSGVPPFHSESAHELGEKHLKEQPPSIKLLRSDTPEALALLIEKLLAKSPASRPADAVAVREVLLPLATGEVTVPGWDSLNPVAWLATSREARQGAPVSASIAHSRTSGMDVFTVHEKLIDDYRAFTEGGTIIRDEDIAMFVKQDLGGFSRS